MVKTKKKSRWLGFWIFCLVVALLALGGIFHALQEVNYQLTELEAKLEAKDAARPELGRDAYMARIDPEYVAQRLDSLYSQVDSRVQTREECIALVCQELSQGIGWKVSFTSSDRQSFLLYNRASVEGKHRQIGQFSIAPQGQASYGYTPWSWVEESFNMDYLLQPGITVTVPHNHTVWVNGNQLGPDCVSVTGIGYEKLKDLPQDLPLPTKTTYTTGLTVGQVTVEIRDPQGNPVTIDETTDWNQFLDNCTQEQEAQLMDLLKDFLSEYVYFSSSGSDIWGNYRRMAKFLVPKGELAQRLQQAIAGMMWVGTRPDTLTDVQSNHLIALEDGRFICDITYTVAAHRNKGDILQSVNLYLILVEVDGELKVESMITY